MFFVIFFSFFGDLNCNVLLVVILFLEILDRIYL